MLIVITGASSGIGRAAAHMLHALGHDIVVVGRDPQRTASVAREVDGDPFVADFDRIADVRELAAKLAAAYPRIDVLANNAGGIISSRGMSADGVERTWQHNVLAPFVLTNALLPTLRESGSTLIFTGSAANKWGTVDPANPNRDGKAWLRGTPAYGAAKRADIMLARQYAKREPELRSYSFHPGAVATGFANLDKSPLAPLVRAAINTPEQGARLLVMLASTRVDAPNGSYFAGNHVDRGLAAQARDEAAGDRRWAALEGQAAAIG
ncbi:SDR family NAD(P)-dependent oxidoreductase [Pseudolysinimonas sp.]|uniref:SDR family NAD(P)-dependent oxidoreductase n=1 Tax=Pseudolysinimonas sp. TaxID=2680009 RepID=UPI003F7ECAFD